MDGELSSEAVDAAARWIEDPNRWSEAVETNYEIGRRFFSYEVAAGVLSEALREVGAL
jgi:hypothetical protein